MSGGVTGDVTNLSNYANTAADKLIQSESGSAFVFNGTGLSDPIGYYIQNPDENPESEGGPSLGESGMGVMFGRVDMRGQTAERQSLR